jgi:hypothetical protein
MNYIETMAKLAEKVFFELDLNGTIEFHQMSPVRTSG